MAGPSNKVQLSLSCRNLVDLDFLSKSDPEVHVYIKDAKAKNYSLVGKTEMILNNLNPDFTRTFNIDYFFEKEQWVKFEVYDDDNTGLEHIGDCETTLAKIMTANKQTFIADLTLPQQTASRGKIVVRADSVAQSNDEVTFRVRAEIQSQGGFCCGADNPYLLIQRSRGGDSDMAASHRDFMRVFQTPSVPANTRPVFGAQRIKMQQMCNSDMNLPMKLQICNYRQTGNHPVYGEVTLTLAQLAASPNSAHTLKTISG